MPGRSQRQYRAVGYFLLWAAVMGAQSPQHRPPKAVYLIAFQGAAEPAGWGDLPAFATTTLRLRLSSLKSLQLLNSPAEAPCRQSRIEGSRSSTDSVDDSAAVPKHYMLSGSVDIHEQSAGAQEINLFYSLDEVEHCQVKNLLQSRVPMAPAEALARFRSMGDVVALRLEEELSDRVPVVVEPTTMSAADEPTRSSAKLLEQLLERRLADSEDFQAARDAASRTRARYHVTARLETKPMRGGSHIDAVLFRVEAGSRHYDLPRESAPAGQDRGALLEFLGDAADSALRALSEIRYRSESGLPDDAAQVETSLVVEKARKYLDQGQARAALALFSGLPAGRQLSPDALGLKGRALFETSDYAAAAEAYDDAAAAGNRDPLFQAQMFSGAGSAWYRARNYANAAERYGAVLPLARKAGQPAADVKKLMRESARWRMASLGLGGKAEQAVGEYLKLRPEVDDPTGLDDEAEELLGGISNLPTLRRMTELLAPSLGTDSPVLVRSWQRLGDDLLAKRDIENARQCYLNALAGAGKRVPPDARQIGTLSNLVGNTYYSASMTRDAIPYYQKAIDKARAGGLSQTVDLVVYLQNMAAAYGEGGALDESEANLIEAQTAAKTAYGAGSPKSATVDLQLGALYTSRGKFAEADLLLTRAAGVLEKQKPRDDANLVLVYKELGWLSYETDRTREAEEFFLKARAILDERGETSTATYGWILADLSSVYGYYGDYAKAISANKGALEIIAKSGNPDDVARMKFNLCDCLDDYQSYREAAAECEKVQKTYQDLYGTQHWMYAYATLALSDIRGAQAVFEAADRLYTDGYRLYSANQAAESWRLLSARKLLGQLRYREGHYQEARVLLEETLRAQIKELGSRDTRAAETEDILGWTYFRIGRYAQAQAEFQAAIAGYEAHGLPGHPTAASSREGLARLALARGDLTNAQALCNRSLTDRIKSFGYDSAAVADSLDCLGLAATARGDRSAAAAHFQRALTAYEQAFGKQHPKIAETLDHFAALRKAAGDNAEAARLAERAAAIHAAFRVP